MNNENSSPTAGGPCRKSMPHDGGNQKTQSLYIVYALPQVFREATGKQRFRETFRAASDCSTSFREGIGVDKFKIV